MLVDRSVVEALIIFAFKHERFELVQELLDLLRLFSEGSSFTLTKKPVLTIVKN